MKASERLQKFKYRHRLYRYLRKNNNFERSDRIWYIITDSGYSDIEGEGPYSLHEVIKKWEYKRGQEFKFTDFCIRPFSWSGYGSYITCEGWSMDQIKERQMDW